MSRLISLESSEIMRLLIIALFALVAVANAEKYAMVFGAAHGWSNYPVYSVSSWT